MEALRDQRGMTIVEAAVAGLLLLIGALATLQLFDVGSRTAYRAEESQVVSNRLQAELERIEALPYEQIAMTANPGTTSDPNDPRSRVSGVSFALARNKTGLQQMVVNGTAPPGGETITTGAVAPGPTPFDVGDVSGHIYRFVTWAPSPCTGCGTAFMKEVVVAAKIEEAPVSFERSFQEVHAQVADPEAVPDVNPGPDDDDDDDTATADFWLTDTPCTYSERQPILGDHPAHNTRGVCSSGLQMNSTRGSPDLMFPGPPPLDETLPPGAQPQYDYATDSEPIANPGLDKGLLMPWSSTDSCLLAPVLNTLDVKRLLENLLSFLNLSAPPGPLDGILDLTDITAGDPSTHRRIHTWVSPRIQGSGGVLLGKGTLELYTRTLNGAIHPGEICAWLSVRQSVTIPRCLVQIGAICVSLGQPTTIEVDLPMINAGLLSNGQCRTGQGLNLTYFRFPLANWPSQWSKVSVPLCFAAVNAAGLAIPAVLPPNSRVVLSMMVKKGGTQPGEGLEFMYDHPDFESRLQLETNRIIGFG